MDQQGQTAEADASGPPTTETRCECGHTFAAHPAGVCAPMFCPCTRFVPKRKVSE